MNISQNQTGLILSFYAEMADGSVKTDLDSSESELQLSIHRHGQSTIASGTLTDKLASEDPWAQGAIYNIGQGKYSLDVHPSVASTLCQELCVVGSFADGGRIIGMIYKIIAPDDQVVRFGAAQVGDQMDLVNAPNANAVTSIQSGLSSHNAADVVSAFGTGSSLTSCLTATGFATAGDAMTLTVGERSTLAGVIDVAILNQGDGADLIGALADAIAADWVASDASPLAVVAALKADDQWSDLTAIQSSINSLNNFDPATDTVARVTLVDTTTDLTNGGGGGSLSAADIRSAIGMASANLDTQLGGIADDTSTDLPNAISSLSAQVSVVGSNVGTIVTSTGVTIPSQISSLNDLSTADIDARLVSYDGPTKAELDAAQTSIETACATVTKVQMRDALTGRYTDEENQAFDLTVTDIP